MKRFGFVVLAVLIGVAGIAVAGGSIRSRATVAVGTTSPAQNTEGIPLNITGTSVFPDPGLPITRVKVTLVSAGSIVSGRLLAWRFINDAGWARDYGNDQILVDAGFPFGGEIVTVPDILYGTNGNRSRVSYSVISIVNADAGTAVPAIVMEGATN